MIYDLRMKRQYGFTLLELLLYISLLGILLGSLGAFTSVLYQSRIKNEVVAEVDGQGIAVMQRITQTIRNAEGINSPATGSSASSTSINVIDSAKDPTLFTLVSGAVTMKEGTDVALPLTSTKVTVSGLTFTNLSRSGTDGTLRVQFTINYNNTVGRQEYNYSKNFVGSATIR